MEYDYINNTGDCHSDLLALLGKNESGSRAMQSISSQQQQHYHYWESIITFSCVRLGECGWAAHDRWLAGWIGWCGKVVSCVSAHGSVTPRVVRLYLRRDEERTGSNPAALWTTQWIISASYCEIVRWVQQLTLRVTEMKIKRNGSLRSISRQHIIKRYIHIRMKLLGI